MRDGSGDEACFPFTLPATLSLQVCRSGLTRKRPGVVCQKVQGSQVGLVALGFISG